MHACINHLVRAELISLHKHVISLQLERDIESQEIAEMIYKYIDENWVSGYVIVDELDAIGRSPQPFPMPGD